MTKTKLKKEFPELLESEISEILPIIKNLPDDSYEMFIQDDLNEVAWCLFDDDLFYNFLKDFNKETVDFDDIEMLQRYSGRKFYIVNISKGYFIINLFD